MSNKITKFLRILLICLLAISVIGLIVFFVQSSSGIYAISNLAEAMATKGSLDFLLIWGYVMVLAAILLVVIMSIINIAGNRKSLKRTGITLLIAVVLIGISYLLASGDPVTVNTATPPTEAVLKMTDTLLNLSYALVVIAVLALIWGSLRNLIHNR